MPTRIIREGINTSEVINSLSASAELFYRRLMTVADDYGRYFAHPSILRAHCFPLQLDRYSDKDVEKMRNECYSKGVLLPYNEGKHLFFPKFGQQRRSRSKFPEPIENELLIKCESNDIHLITELAPDSSTSTTTSTTTTTTTNSNENEKENKILKPVADLPEKLRTERMMAKWQLWMETRRAMKKPKSWAVLFNEQIELLAEYDEPEAFEMVSASIRNGWQGLFRPKGAFQRTADEVPDYSKGF
jgi:hypothetical protein